ncbi:MAG TPA: hypothetical protein VL287_13990 [Gemmatimonadales bacterium]|jgi:hypothetical protein|nr:hypothetical protein [Gemmatimonadales bacterium]
MFGLPSIAVAALAGVLSLNGPGPTVSSSRPAVNLPPGTSVPVTIDQDIPLKKDQFGQVFPAHVTRNVVVNGKVSVPEGTPAKVKLVQSADSAGNEAATLQLAEVQVDGKSQTVSSSNARPDSERSHEGWEKKTGIGAAAGAVVGAITGVGLVKGAVLGAGGGLAWGLLGGGKQIGKDTQVEFQTT